MLAAALADPNPVLIFEHVMLYNMEGELDPAVTAVDIEPRPRCRREAATSRWSTYGDSLFKTLDAADDAGRGRHRGRGDRPARAAAARHGDDPGIGRAGRGAVVIVDEGWRSGSISAEIAHAHRRGRVLRARRADPPGLRRAKCRSRTPRISKHAALPQPPTSRPRRAAWCAGQELAVTDFLMPSLGADMEDRHPGRVAGQARRPRHARATSSRSSRRRRARSRSRSSTRASSPGDRGAGRRREVPVGAVAGAATGARARSQPAARPASQPSRCQQPQPLVAAPAAPPPRPSCSG